MTAPHLFTPTTEPTTTAGRIRAAAEAHGWRVATFAGDLRATRSGVSVLVTMTSAGRVAGYTHSIDGAPQGLGASRDKAARVLAILTEPAADVADLDDDGPAAPAVPDVETLAGPHRMNGPARVLFGDDYPGTVDARGF